ncbi:CRTAC1 family protein [Robertkochia solimangrovi]|nr:CRTAC1 family protein [Robertkochia solimangrovi]
MILMTSIAMFTGCKKEKELAMNMYDMNRETLFTLMDPDSTGFDFQNKVENQKNFNIFKYRNFYNGGGVAIGDINNDGLPDIYMTANMGQNKLFLNKGNMKFEDITIQAGVAGHKPWSTGVNMIDINQDGLLDIYVSNAGNMEGNNHDNDLYINNGDLTFTEMAEKYNLAKSGFSTHATFFDYDKDGDLDAYILNNSNIPVSSLGYAEQREVRAQDWEGVPEIFRGVGDMLLRNDNGTFTDVSEEAGIYGSLIGFGLGVMVTDINKDNYPDIYVSNDFYERDYLYINNQDGTFTEDIKNWTSHLCLSAMGVDIADINNDGNNDIFITDMLPEEDQRTKSVMTFEGYNVFKLKQKKDFYQQYIQNTLQLNNGNQSFSEVAYFSGIAKTDWSWAGLMFDMDNDGFRDIFVTNGINHDLTDLDFVDFFANDIIQNMALTGRKESIDSIIAKMPITPIPNYAFRNNHDLTFDNVAENWGLEQPSLSNGCAYGDLDNDGDLDLVVNNVNMPSFLYRNNSDRINGNHFIKLQLEGVAPNLNAIGSTVNVYFEDQVITQEVIPARGFQSSMEYNLTIGIGKTEMIDSIRVIWPDDRTDLLTGIKANSSIKLTQGNSQIKYNLPNPKTNKTLLKEIPTTELLAHKENMYNDFDHEGLLYKMLSQEGPAMATGDFDNDGNDDLYIGGAAGSPGAVYMHYGNGKLKQLPQEVLKKDAFFEDTAAAIFDADGDGDLDLMVGSGGNETTDARSYLPRLYLNDGKGNLSAAPERLPSLFHNISVIAPCDFDKDGDLDVMIGSRSVVGTYGMNPEHLFLVNTGNGKFENKTSEVAFDLNKAGMITNATWADIDGNGTEDLITVSDWGAPMVFTNTGQQLESTKGDLDKIPGWWNAVKTADVNNDGKTDLILGNMGLNIPYRPTMESPMKIWVNDFDNNGSIEQVVTRTINGKDYPVHMQKELTAQLVSLKKQNLKASEYSNRSMEELFSEDVLGKALVKKVTQSASIVALNQGNGNYEFIELPSRVQLSCVCDINCQDLNNDGALDLIMAGNNYEFKPQMSRLDANYGSVLINNGKGDFTWQDYNKSGFFVKDEVKYLRTLNDQYGNSFLVVAINNNEPKIFMIDKETKPDNL